MELDEIKETCKKHEDLCRQFTECCRELQQNDAQLEILGETATYLRKKHEQIRRTMRERTMGEKELQLLEEEIGLIDKQVCIWMKELEEINENRLQIEVDYGRMAPLTEDIQIRFLQLGNELKKSVTCVQLASIDFELIQMRHKERWQRYPNV